ncbi:type II toxin-antitoxin system RelE/ParE family toxin [Embleya sp. NBC_00896]|uniref:type II toxin-antitoxin system RelE/ParE family toxin n=1 Tax=Embleya sp. NBC_00896 TaxID=2975961 RepID=UPI0038640035|nr:type II toxin-antitoxin system RelE/ParE family toxin [Embleya sp. NBC_00896]
MAWRIVVLEPARSWLHGLRVTDRSTLEQISAAIRELQERGPGLGRPLVDTIAGSAIQNLKELRPGSSGRSEVRILFVFDPTRQAVVLVGGDKAGIWKSWYPEAIKLAEESYAQHLRELSDD